jgi:hypothetical protein
MQIVQDGVTVVVQPTLRLSLAELTGLEPVTFPWSGGG